MGQIKPRVYDEHLNHFPEEEEIIKPFLSDFEVTWARRQWLFNADLSVYFLYPEKHIQESHGLAREVLLVYSPYEQIQARTLQAVEKILSFPPAKGRVEQMVYFLVSEDPKVKDWLESYLVDHPESRIIVAFRAEDLRFKARGNSWFVRNILTHQMFGRDLFDYRLPLKRDIYFFGRDKLFHEFYDAIRRLENKGLFGLRKTGKTSFLFKIQRRIEKEPEIGFFYYDCKSPSVRMLRWFELLEKIGKNVAKKFNVKISRKAWQEVRIADTFEHLCREVEKSGKKFVFAFDEIEYISPVTNLDKHWHHDFIPFWQALWAAQSKHRVFSVIIAGVSPKVVEIDKVEGIQNPLFGIVSPRFLTGFSSQEVKTMLRVLGKRMGLRFDEESQEYIFKRYGGHPLLTRIACSLINSKIVNDKEDKPVDISVGRLRSEEEERDADLVFYCGHVVSELRQFYPDEYEMLELLASGQISDFLEFAAFREFTHHLRSYGLLEYNDIGRPYISIAVVGRYIGLELARREGRKSIYRVIEPSKRKVWLTRRVESILNDLRFLERLIRKTGNPELFGANSFPEGDRVKEIRVCQTQQDFDVFINICYRAFVESIEYYGRSIGKPNYYWEDIRKSYPGLWNALQRIRVYRNYFMHLGLYPHVDKELQRYLNQDLEGKSPGQVEDLYFVLQQCVLDELFTGIQIEIRRID